MIGAIVPPEEQPRASAQLSAAFSTAQVIGPPIAAPLLFTFGVQWALILNAASFAFSFWCVRAISLPPEPAGRERAATRRTSPPSSGPESGSSPANRVLVTVAIGIVIAMLGNGAVNSLAVFFIPHNLHVAGELARHRSPAASARGAIVGRAAGRR